MIALLVMTDGRDDLLARTRSSAEANVSGQITRVLVHDDTGDPEHAVWLKEWWPEAEVIGGPKAGFGGAIRRAWTDLAVRPERFVFHLEDDFVFNRPVDLDEMARVLDAQPHLVQLALRRQSWNESEQAAGGIVEQHPDDYSECGDGIATWLEHRRFFTTNPSLYRRDLCKRGWPECRYSEGVFSHELFADPDARSAFWGSRDSGEWVHHIGTERVGTGY